MRLITEIIIHCADTPPGMNAGVEEIRRWHLERGFADIGYHYVIRRDGSREKGRDIEQPGAHVKGRNANSIGVCLVGGMARSKAGDDCNFTRQQWAELDRLVSELTRRYPGVTVSGHRDHDSGKSCPTFDVAAWMGK